LVIGYSTTYKKPSNYGPIICGTLDGMEIRLPHYSAEIDKTMKVIEKLKEEGQ